MADQRLLTLIQEDRPLDFNHVVDSMTGDIDLTDSQFRGYDLRKFHLQNANLSGAYFRNADLRGLDLSNAKLHGASFKDAKLSGVLFPIGLSAEEVRLSWEHGTRVRVPESA